MSMSRKERRKSGDELAKKYLDLGRTNEFFKVLECIPRNPTEAEMDRIVRHHIENGYVSFAVTDAENHRKFVAELTANRILDEYIRVGNVSDANRVCYSLLGGRNLSADEFRQLSQNIS